MSLGLATRVHRVGLAARFDPNVERHDHAVCIHCGAMEDLEASPAPEAVRDARRLLRPLRAEMVRLLQRLVQVDSVAIPPDGKETPAQKVLQRFLRAHRVDAETYDTGFLKRSRMAHVRSQISRASSNAARRLPLRAVTTAV